MRRKKIEKIREKLTNDFYQARRKNEQHSTFLTWVKNEEGHRVACQVIRK
jgi:hypothetical protein